MQEVLLRYRQQEVGPVLVAAWYNGDNYIPNGVIYILYIFYKPILWPLY